MLFFKKRRGDPPAFTAELAPDVPFYAIGDIHGSDDLLQKLLDKLASDAHPEAVLVCVGDYVDRGEQSAEVLRRLFHMETEAAGLMTCLMGNHEEMMIRFLKNPAKHGSRWLRYGGLQTLASFKISGVPGASASPEEWQELRDVVRDALGADLEKWLGNLPKKWMTGNVAVVHAGADPEIPLADQGSSTLLWGHPKFDAQPRQDGIWVVHGHTIVDAAQASQGRISIDTGAYATGKLTAALIEKGKVSFMSA